MRAVGGWLAGILATIIGGYLLWYLTQPPSATVFEGMVYSGSSPVARALVSLELAGNGANGGPFHDSTDENGSYRLDFTGLSKDARATLSVAASGYGESEPKSLPTPLGPDNHLDFPLTPVSKIFNPHPGVTQTLPGAPARPRYVPKAAEKATQVRLQPKP
jgi:hypothetical protein